jgi:5-methylcytosine-specific restriction endonuclease McrA
MQYYRRYIKTNDSLDQINDLEVPETHGSYGALLLDKRWKEKRLLILMRDENKCVICNSDKDLQVHHRQYHFVKAQKKFRPPWEYQDESLLTLCNGCHQRGHSQFKVPIIYI